MDEELNPTGVAAQPQETATPEQMTPELAESLPYAELKARMRAEARDHEEPATTAEGSDTPEDAEEGAVTPTKTGTERDPATGRFAASPSNSQGQTAEREYKQPQTLEEAIRVLDSVRGNLATNINERNSAQQRAQELEAANARLQQEQRQKQMQAQHDRFEGIVARMSPEQQAVARAEYVNLLQQEAMRDYGQGMQQREAALNAREFQAAKSEVPGLYRDIAAFVAQQYDIPTQELETLVNSKQVQDLIAAAQTPEAMQQATIAFGQLLDWHATQVQTRGSAAKAARREARSGTQVRDMPNGVTAGGAQEDVVAKITKMTRTEFDAHRKKLLRAQR